MSGELAPIVTGEVLDGPVTLDDLATTANREHALALQSGVAMVEHALRAGEALTDAKAQVRHGEWMPWLAENFDAHPSTATRYMQLAANRARVHDLEEPSLRKALRAVSGPDEPLAMEAPGPLPEGQFRVIVADPPWQYGNRATRGAAEDHYQTMDLDQLAALDVSSHAADEAHLYLWVTNGFLREGFTVLEAWGFTYKTCVTWVKPQIGMGNYFRSSTEHVLFGTRGGLGMADRTLRNWFEAPRARHSSKPDCFYDLVERASPGPYLEMFARRRRLGWSGWGDEA